MWILEVMASRDPVVCEADRGMDQGSRCCRGPVTVAVLTVFLRCLWRKTTDTSRQARTSSGGKGSQLSLLVFFNKDYEGRA